MKINKETIIQAADHLEQTLIMKNHDYGNSVEEQYNEYGLTSLLIRLDDKMKRLKNLQKQAEYLVEESVADTLLDIAGYAELGWILFTQNEEVEVNPFAKELEELRAMNKRLQKELQKANTELVQLQFRQSTKPIQNQDHKLDWLINSSQLNQDGPSCD